MKQNEPPEAAAPTERELFFQALAVNSAEERQAFLDGACYHRPELRRRLEELLAGHAQDDSFLRQPAAELPDTIKLEHPPDEPAGTVVGRYKLLQKIGEGGMGVVYMAEQTEPVTRKVALKIIRLGMDTKQVVARFEAERQALAMMDHPNIAKVLDAGATDTGRPYFVMELVRGVPITEYCDKNKLSTKARLELFIPVCQAIQHAHQKGVIHRDIKPSNVMVTLNDGVPHPMVIDFGIAKAINQKLTEKTLFTNYAQMIGTPAYMSPEQAEMSKLDVDTRTDVYSLGVLLYELLTGTTPFPSKELLSLGYGEMQKIIAEKEPPKPSTRLSTMQNEERTVVAKNRSMEVSALGKVFQGDLDWIVMKALEKDRTHRYETVNGLVSDIRRHMDNEPVSAAAPTFSYQFHKFIRRNRKYARAAAVVAVLLIVATVFATFQAVRATRASQLAEKARRAESNQRLLAQQKQKDAETAQALASEQRLVAQRKETYSRQLLYASEMNAVYQAFQDEDRERALQLLTRHIPQGDQPDLRSWEWRYLWALCRSDALEEFDWKTTIGGMDREYAVTTLSISHDGELVAAGTGRLFDTVNSISIWNRHTKKPLPNLPKAFGWVRTAFSPTADLLAFSSQIQSGKEDQRIHFWNTRTFRDVGGFDLEGPCQGLAFSDDGKTLVAAQGPSGWLSGSSQNSAIVVWDVAGGKATKTIAAPALFGDLGVIEPLAFSSRGQLLAYTCASSNSYNKVQVCDLADSGKPLWSDKAGQEYVVCVSLTRDGRLLATGGGHGPEAPQLWDARTGDRLSSLSRHRGFVNELMFWPDGTMLATAGSDQTIRLWDVSDPRRPKHLRALRGHRAAVWQLALSPNGKTLISGDHDGKILTWDVDPQDLHRTSEFELPVQARRVAFANDGKSLVTVDADGQVSRWSGPDFQSKATLFDVGADPGLYCAFLDDRFLATATKDGYVSFWDVEKRQRAYPPRLVRGGILAVLDDQRVMLAGDADPEVSEAWMYEWDLASDLGRPVRQKRVAHGTIPFATISNNGEWMLSSRGGDPVNFLGTLLENRKSGAAGIPIEENRLSMNACFSDDAALFCLQYIWGTAKVFETATLKEKTEISNSLRSVWGAAFTHDNRRLAVIRPDRTELWDVETGQPVLSFSLQEPILTPDKPQSILFSPDGTSLLTIHDNNVVIRRAPSWEEIQASEKTGGSN